MNPLDLDRIRSETPGCGRRIHLNNAGAALMPGPVVDGMVEHLKLEAMIGGYEARAERAAEVAATYDAVASLLGADPHQIALTENATAAYNQALSAVPFERGDVLLTTKNDYASNQIAFLSLQQRFGIEIVRADDLPEGGVDPDHMERLIHRRRPRLVAVTHVPTNSGLVQPIEPIGAACRRADVLYLVDACQSVGQMAIDVGRIQCDFLSATARKFLRGPRGIGFLAVSDRALDEGLEPLFPDMRGADWIEEDLYQPAPDARRFENWEFAYALVLGLGEATRYTLDVGIDTIEAHARSLAQRLRDGLSSIAGVELQDRGPELCAIVTVTVEGWDPDDLVVALRTRGVNTSASPRVVAVIDYDEKGVEGTVRFSPHYYNSEEEIDRAVDELDACLRERHDLA